MRDPWPAAIQETLESCRLQSAHRVLSSGEWAKLRQHCSELAIELDALGHSTIARRVDRDYSRLHGQLRESTDSGVSSNSLLLVDAVNELASTLAAISRFQRAIVAAPAVSSEDHADARSAKARSRDRQFQIGGPEPDPLDTRRAMWVGKPIYLGEDTQVSRLFWLLAKPVGVARTLGEVQRAVDGMETDRDCEADEVKRAGQRVRKAISKLRRTLRESGMDDHVLIVTGGTQAEPEYTMIWRYNR